MIEGKRFLVTGASGFIGGATCNRLLKEGAIVHGVSRSPVKIDHSAWRHWQLDLSIAQNVQDLFEEVQPHYVLHLASCVTGQREVEWVLDTVSGNLNSAINILVAGTNTGTQKIVLAGSLEEPACNEINPVPASPYAASKWCASAYARMFHALYDTSVAVARIFMVYGPGQNDHKKLVPYVCLAALKNEAPQLMSGGRPVDWIYVDDVVDGLLRMTQKGVEDGSHVDLGSGDLVTTGDVAIEICELSASTARPKMGALPDRPMEQIRCANVNETERLLDWRPRIGLRAGLEETLAYYRTCLDQGKGVVDVP